MISTINISTSGLVAQRIQLDTIAGNIANAQTTRRLDGKPGPFLRRVALLSEGAAGGKPGVHVADVVEDNRHPTRAVKDPSHPDADENGIVYYPNVDMATEMVNAMIAVRAYEANVTAMEATKSIIASSMRLLA